MGAQEVCRCKVRFFKSGTITPRAITNEWQSRARFAAAPGGVARADGDVMLEQKAGRGARARAVSGTA